MSAQRTTPVTLVETWVPGIAKTKGSLDIVGKRLTESVRGSEAWRVMVAQRLREDLARRVPSSPSYTGPVTVTLTVLVPEPQPAASGALSAALATFRAFLAPIWEQSGDIDKLARNVLDALSSPKKPEDARKCAGVIVDDVQVAVLIATKMVAPGIGPPGAYVKVTTMPFDTVHTHRRWALQQRDAVLSSIA